MVLSAILAEHAHQIRSFEVEAGTWHEIICLCKQLAFTNMPRLQIWNMMSISNLVYHDDYDEAHPVEALSILVYPFYLDSEPVLNQELKHSGTLLYPALTDVTLCSIPVLTKYPLGNRLLMQTLHAILSNSKDTLETLTLKWVISAEDLDIGYMHTQEACQIFQTLNFPALHSLMLQGLPDYKVDRSVIFIDMMKYLPVEKLDKLSLLSIKFPLGDLPDHDLVKEGSITKESLPVLLQFICQLVLVHTLVVSHCSKALLKYMNYARGGSMNMVGLKVLICKDTKDPEIGIVPFLQE
ncbi:hypothetical protein EDD18DRAFT_1356309 [Armillaria luteobubalina]|uniref:Uncharacterized protein n=1 Tax=Armillaria luteobubalina TaxID=153913 RepID=A0AA39Q2X3_9AGAR|nr:hypothetical protein EDD18DRAFT_1356309 [Armillaria luteobubalina]